jgi:predicted acylesterase/phospholipase RssA
VIDAVYTSSSLPIFFKPLCIENETFIDGGILVNYPLRECLNTPDINPLEILGINKVIPNTNKDMITDTKLDQLEGKITDKLQNQVNILSEPITTTNLYDFTYSENMRKNTIEVGVKEAKDFLDMRLL